MSSYEEKNGHEMENMRRKMGSNWGWEAMRKNWAWGGKQRTKNGFKLGMNSYETENRGPKRGSNGGWL
jgi:hypothetical protein